MSKLIQWHRAQYWDKPWNPILGCRPCSLACDHCYAKTLAEERFKQSFEPHHTKQQFPPTTGVVFCGNMTDLFGGWVDRPYLHLAAAHGAQYKQKAKATATYLWLTKRVENLCRSMDELTNDPLWQRHYFGFTAENQEWYDRRFKAWREMAPLGFNGWLSAEPLLGPIDLHLGYIAPEDIPFKWVAVGCESGPKRRPCKLEWIEGIVQQCLARGIPVFVKQIDIDGRCERDLLKFPHHLQIRQVPWATED